MAFSALHLQRPPLFYDILSYFKSVFPHFTLWCLAGFGDFGKKTTGSHVALDVHNLVAESGRELFKGSKDTASLVVHTQKIFFGWGCRFFVSDVISGGLLGHLGPLHLAWGSNH